MSEVWFLEQVELPEVVITVHGQRLVFPLSSRRLEKERIAATSEPDADRRRRQRQASTSTTTPR